MRETYGIIQDGKLVVVPKHYPGAKPVVYECLPRLTRRRSTSSNSPPWTSAITSTWVWRSGKWRGTMNKETKMCFKIC